MKMLIAPVVAIVGVAAGGGGAVLLKSSQTGATAGQAATHEDGKGYRDGGDQDKSRASGIEGAPKSSNADHSSDHAGEAADYGYADDSIFYKFSREFVVPVLKDGKVASLIILNIQIEADESSSQDLFQKDPKLRDNIMTTLIELSGDGRTFVKLTDVQTYESLRAIMLDNLRSVVPNGLRNVLIVDVAKQDL